ncbi:MAG: mannitol dehydrogenase family protein, partial [Pseudomonadota bacterium]
TLAYLGYLKGHETVADAIANPDLSQLITDLMTAEIIPILDMPKEVDLYAYRDALIERFQNKSLKHRTWQIAMDGSQKLPQRLLDSVRERIKRGEPYTCLAQGIAGWMRYATGIDLNGNPIDVRDPMREKLKSIGEQYLDDPGQLVSAFTQIEAIFGADLSVDTAFRQQVLAAYKYHFA